MLTHWLSMPSILSRIVRICCSLFKCNYFKKEQLFLGFLFHFWNLPEIWKVFKKRKIVIANVFLKLQTVKHLVWELSKKCRLRTSIDSQHVKRSQTIMNSAWENFYHIFPSLWREMIQKISALSKSEISGAFFNTLTGDDKYAFPDCENLGFPIPMQFS